MKKIVLVVFVILLSGKFFTQEKPNFSLVDLIASNGVFFEVKDNVDFEESFKNFTDSLVLVWEVKKSYKLNSYECDLVIQLPSNVLYVKDNSKCSSNVMMYKLLWGVLAEIKCYYYDSYFPVSDISVKQSEFLRIKESVEKDFRNRLCVLMNEWFFDDYNYNLAYYDILLNKIDRGSLRSNFFITPDKVKSPRLD